MKKFKYLLLCFIVLLSSIVVYADFKEGSTDYTSTVNEKIDNARLYEKSIESKVNKTFEWYPTSEGDFDAEYGEDFQLGVSDSPDNFMYYYDVKRDYLIQYFKVNEKSGLLIWNKGVPISYEEFN